MAATAQAEAISQRDEANKHRATAVAQASLQMNLAATAQAETIRQRELSMIAQAIAVAGIEAKYATAVAQQPEVTISPADPSYQPTPYIFEYAIPFDNVGTGQFSIEAQDSVLFHFRPDDVSTEIEFVKALTLYMNIGQGSTADAPVDFSVWSPQSGGWGINQGKNELAWGQNEIDLKYPDPYLTRAGDIYISVRNYGSEPIEIEDMNFSLLVRNFDDTETVYSPGP